MNSSNQHGIILLEVLFAALLMALALTAAIGASTQGMSTVTDMRSQTIAQIIASNKLTELQLTKEWPTKTKTVEKTTMAGIDWNITVETTPTSAEIFKDIIVQADVSVSFEDKPDSKLRTVTGFLVREGASLNTSTESR